eukprot:COSAG01_NODE_7886_length_3007_cov_1.991747_5_plen_82_part_00
MTRRTAGHSRSLAATDSLCVRPPRHDDSMMMAGWMDGRRTSHGSGARRPAGTGACSPRRQPRTAAPCQPPSSAGALSRLMR